MDLDKVYRELLSRIHRELLKPEGFKKEGGNFRLFHENGRCKIVSFQRSMYNDRAECRFCINVGLYIQKDLQNPNLRFKGSANQRIIMVQESLRADEVVLWNSEQ